MNRDTARVIAAVGRSTTPRQAHDRKSLFQALPRDQEAPTLRPLSINLYDPVTTSLSYFSTAAGVSPRPGE